jgi:hypothetical protein
MDAPSSKSPLRKIFDVLWTHDVAFILIGGQAEAIMGSPRVTYDVDICYKRTPGNFIALAAALQQLGVTLRGAPADVPFQINARTLESGCNFTFDTPLVPFDILGFVDPIGDYDALMRNQCKSMVTSCT